MLLWYGNKVQAYDNMVQYHMALDKAWMARVIISDLVLLWYGNTVQAYHNMVQHDMALDTAWQEQWTESGQTWNKHDSYDIVELLYHTWHCSGLEIQSGFVVIWVNIIQHCIMHDKSNGQKLVRFSTPERPHILPSTPSYGDACSRYFVEKWLRYHGAMPYITGCVTA